MAGVAALLQSRAQAAGQTLTPAQLIQIITQSGDKLPQMEGLLKTGARLNAYKAVQALNSYLQQFQSPSPLPSPLPPARCAPVPGGGLGAGAERPISQCCFVLSENVLHES